MLNIKIGMSFDDFFGDEHNRKYFKYLSEDAKNRVSCFWNNDLDGIITNENEVAILEGFSSESGKVEMPKGNPALYEDDWGYSGKKSAHITRYYSESNSWYPKDVNKKHKKDFYESDCFIYEKTDKNNTSTWSDKSRLAEDILYDDDKDGYADRRIYTQKQEQRHFVSKHWVDRNSTVIYTKYDRANDTFFIDDNMDGRFRVEKPKKFIHESIWGSDIADNISN